MKTKTELRIEVEASDDGACLEDIEKAIAQAAGSCGVRVLSIHGGDSLAEQIAKAGMIDAAKRGFFDGEGQTPEQMRENIDQLIRQMANAPLIDDKIPCSPDSNDYELVLRLFHELREYISREIDARRERVRNEWDYLG